MMRAVRIGSAFLLVAMMAVLAFYSQTVTTFIVSDTRLSWNAAYIIPRLLFVVLLLSWLWSLLPLIQLTAKARISIGVLLFGAAIGGFLILNPPYLADWQRMGEDVSNSFAQNEVEATLRTAYPDFDGLVMLALPNCPYCFMAYPQMELLKQREKELDVAVFVSAKDSFGVQFFEEKIGESEIPVHLLSDRNQATELSNGKFPTFLYFKQGELIHRWSSDQFGYPALDWVEDRLN